LAGSDSKHILKTLRDLFVDGLLLALPVGFAAFLVYKVVGKLTVLLMPAEYFTPEAGWWKFFVVELAAFSVLVLAVIILGAFARTALGKGIVTAVENVVLSKVPGYQIIMSTIRDVADVETGSDMRPAFVHYDMNSVLGLIMEESADGGTFTVFLPSSPGATTGTVKMFPKERVQILDRSTKDARESLKKRGVGMQALAHDRPGSDDLP